MVSKSEEAAGRSLRSVLATPGVGDALEEESEEFAELQNALELFLALVLQEAYPAQWKHESFDNFRWAAACKTGPMEANLLGLGLLISDQSWTPIHVRLRVESMIDAISWVSCKVGDGGPGGKRMTRLPYGSSKEVKLLFSVGQKPENIDWAFSVIRTAPGQAVQPL